MKFLISKIVLVFSILTTATATIEVEAAPEPMTFAEKLALIEGDGNRRSMRELQASLTYKGNICSTETQMMMFCSTRDSDCRSSDWDYWRLNLQAGTTYTIEVDRVTCSMDPALSLFQGVGTTLPEDCFYIEQSTETLTFVAESDDNDPEPAFCLEQSSPFSDPKITVTPDTTGPFTLAVINFASNIELCTGAVGYQYKVIINPSPSCS
ncbi:hypothetical protein FisN_26Hh022 [Fistulifera solaris]|uniref:Uncharacterized protein n=1 Tax=Fistulifera solaris TaxID=1519565 RepID=A0A1Z5JXY7_FISSO|nr:hypothetical protein FisN_26Hh022 [Fistulifera solaris]|eukprot:GAX18732.1 hypothetical protein FisN_26Hh022 [Fistulifera solaris]